MPLQEGREEAQRIRELRNQTRFLLTSLPSAARCICPSMDCDSVALCLALSSQSLFYSASRWVKDCGSCVFLGQTLWSPHFPILLAWTWPQQTCIQGGPGSLASDCSERGKQHAAGLFKLRWAELALGSCVVGQKRENGAIKSPSWLPRFRWRVQQFHLGVSDAPVCSCAGLAAELWAAC